MIEYKLKLYVSSKHAKLRKVSGKNIWYTKSDYDTCTRFCDIRSACYASANPMAENSWLNQDSYSWEQFLHEVESECHDGKLRLCESGELPYTEKFILDYDRLFSLGMIALKNNLKIWAYTHLPANQKNAKIAKSLEALFGIVIRFSVTNKKALALAIRNSVKYSPITSNKSDPNICACQEFCVTCNRCFDDQIVSFYPHGSCAAILLEHIKKQGL